MLACHASHCLSLPRSAAVALSTHCVVKMKRKYCECTTPTPLVRPLAPPTFGRSSVCRVFLLKTQAIKSKYNCNDHTHTGVYCPLSLYPSLSLFFSAVACGVRILRLLQTENWKLQTEAHSRAFSLSVCVCVWVLRVCVCVHCWVCIFVDFHGIFYSVCKYTHTHTQSKRERAVYWEEIKLKWNMQTWKICASPKNMLRKNWHTHIHTGWLAGWLAGARIQLQLDMANTHTRTHGGTHSCSVAHTGCDLLHYQ